MYTVPGGEDMKSLRQKEILEIISQNKVETQEQLASELSRRGFKVTQATVSRDIKKLGLVKIPLGAGRYCYALPNERKNENIQERLQSMFRNSVLSLDYSENLILIRTLPGAANAVASCIDKSEWKEIMGTLAGDDTILVIVKNKEKVEYVMKCLEDLL